MADFNFIDRTTRLICHVGDMIRRKTDKRRSNKLKVIAELKVNTKTWVSKNTESAMFKDDMLPLTENQENTSSLPSLLNFNESKKVNLDLSSFFNKLEEKRE